MKIYPVNNFKYNTLNNRSLAEKPEEVSNTTFSNYAYTDLTFRAAVNLQRPVFENSIIQNLAEKIVSYSKRLPELSKLTKPVILKYADGVVGFLMDKTANNETLVSIKMVENADELGKMGSLDGEYSALEMKLNEKGQMIHGIYYSMPDRMNYLFERSNRNVRRIHYANALYKPTKEDGRWTKMVPTSVEYHYYTALRNILDFPETKLQELFIQLAKIDTALF